MITLNLVDSRGKPSKAALSLYVGNHEVTHLAVGPQFGGPGTITHREVETHSDPLTVIAELRRALDILERQFKASEPKSRKTPKKRPAPAI